MTYDLYPFGLRHVAYIFEVQGSEWRMITMISHRASGANIMSSGVTTSWFEEEKNMESKSWSCCGNQALSVLGEIKLCILLCNIFQMEHFFDHNHELCLKISHRRRFEIGRWQLIKAFILGTNKKKRRFCSIVASNCSDARTLTYLSLCVVQIFDYNGISYACIHMIVM